MIRFIDIPTEQTTAVTDLLLAFISSFLSYYIYRFSKNIDRYKGLIWSWAFGLLAFAAFLGAGAHGIQMSEQMNYLIWQPLYLSLGLVVALFVVGVVYDKRGFSLPPLFVYLFVFIGILFYAFTLLFPGLFIVFIFYEGVAMIFSLLVYLAITYQKRLPGSGFMAMGIFISIIAAVVQTIEKIHFKLILEFDFNGLFHLIQIIGMIFLFKGLIIELKSRR
ncbi:MAG: hypothetical protein K8S16_05770 [Bacteroidales bacterium]|nr:hypothetical protein [Bacteroidales bacterium]